MTSASESLYLILLLLSAVSAVLLFIRTQLWMNDPRRREFNEQWFIRFQSYIAERYRDNGITWRVHALEGSFARAEQDSHLLVRPH